ncbi:Stress response protein NST1 [Venustampulla echinocandica]|uniref:Stress response protein NST1 n=1 Tax=Venustampulla echinocandica TaxID=2656787 RepID=A0A370U340_9HELO|nr:Stress response protein NST1 [Venustampulla echinocandica]RDL42153.1 Stress response protein NST1 [Venustampulla echinocandica]
MPANRRQQTAQSPASPTCKATAKYTNKDGSKFITVPKSYNTSDSSETSPTMAQTTTKPNGQMPAPPTDASNAAPTVNRKKQKRRQKQAAKLAAEQPAMTSANGAQTAGDVKRQIQELEARFREHGLDEQFEGNGHGQFDPAEGDQYYSDEGDEYSGSYGHEGSSANGYAMPPSNPSDKKSKRKKKPKGHLSGNSNHPHPPHATNGLSHDHVPLPLPPLGATNMPRGPGISKEKIWNTSSQEERERIKEFWLSLGEDERKSLVKVEKDAVLKKMKEQQKHSCSCTVCGRKRTAIEEELEVLYDAYYEELEQYANHQGDGGPPPMMPPPRRFGAMSGLQPPHRLPPAFNGQQPSRGRIVEQLGDDEDEEGDEEYSEDEGDEDDYSDEEPEEIPRSNHAADFFSFGNSLTVQGGILTVADDLLKNDGKKFIEMMEQLAERRMAREEDAREQQYSNPNYGHPPNGAMHSHSHAHNHPPLPDDEEYDEEDEEEDEYDSQDEDYDEEEMDTMTEEQRMEEGRRMFQIFAARMFEQRVLTAYKEKVAKERQQKLLEELEEESRADSEKKAKKAKDAQKKKDRLAQKKQALGQEKARREAEKAAEEAARLAAEEKKAEEQRLKAEEKRKKKEAQKKAEEEERLKKEAEKQRRIQEQRERQAELERKQREAKEKERKDKEELRRKEREAKDAKEREAKERKEKLEKEKLEKEAKAKAEKDAREKQKREELAAQQAAVQASQAATQILKRPQPPVPIPANLQPTTTSIASPHIPVATPAIPKAPTPIKLRTSSQQESSGSIPQTPQSSGLSQNVSPAPSASQQGSPGPIGPPGKNQTQHPFLHHPQATSPIHAALKSPPGMQPPPFGNMQPMGMGFQPGMPMMAPGFGGRMPHEPIYPHQQPMGAPFRPLAGPNGMPLHPGLNMHQIPQGRGFPLPHAPPGFPQVPNGLGGIGQPFAQKDGPSPQTHSRQQSASYEKPFEPSTSVPQAQPIARPAPIGRPSSVVHGHRQGGGNSDVDDLSNHLGSSALLDDSDEPLNPGGNGRRSSAVHNINTRPNFAPPFGMEPPAFASPMSSYNTWGGPPNPFGPSSLPSSNLGGGWGSANSSFGAVGGAPLSRPLQPRSVAIRLMICRACKSMEGSTPDRYSDINRIKEHIDHFNPPNEPVSEKEILDICETEGSPMNGGGSFDIRQEGNGYFIRYEDATPIHRPIGAPGEIGSPIVGGGGIRFSGPPPGF